MQNIEEGEKYYAVHIGSKDLLEYSSGMNKYNGRCMCWYINKNDSESNSKTLECLPFETRYPFYKT